MYEYLLVYFHRSSVDTILRKQSMCHQHIEGKMAPITPSSDCRCSKSGAWSLPKPHFPQLLQEHSLHLAPTAPDSPWARATQCHPCRRQVAVTLTCLKTGWGCPLSCAWDHVELVSQLRPPPPRPSALGAPCGVLGKRLGVESRSPSPSPVIPGPVS